MIYFLTAVLFLLAVYFACRHFLLRRSVSKAANELREISGDLTANRIVKLAARDDCLEKLLEAVDDNLAAIRREHVEYARKERQLKEQIENISHDLRTPLTAILGYLKLIDRESLGKEDAQYLDIAIRKSETLQRLIGQFYELSCVTAHDFELKKELIDSARILRETCLEHYALLEERQLNFHPDIPETAAVICGDGEALKRIFTNLLQNSTRYASGEVRAALYRDREQKKVHFVFSNDIAPGLQVEDSSRLFDRFYMQEQSRSHGGTGLGLTISKSLTELMDGTINAEYGDGGSQFRITVTLPLQSSKM